MLREETIIPEETKEAVLPQARDFAAERKALVEELKPLLKEEGTQLKQAELWLKLADLSAEEKGTKGNFEVEGYLSSAQAQLVAPELVHDKAYAEACRKAAPVFDRLGRGAFAKQLLQNASLL